MEVSLGILRQSAKLNVCQSVFVIKSPNLMSVKCTTPMVCRHHKKCLSTCKILGVCSLFNLGLDTFRGNWTCVRAKLQLYMSLSKVLGQFRMSNSSYLMLCMNDEFSDGANDVTRAFKITRLITCCYVPFIITLFLIRYCLHVASHSLAKFVLDTCLHSHWTALDLSV